MVEFALAIPVFLILLLGTMEVAFGIVDSVKAETATGQAARLASLVGGSACPNGGTLTQDDVDQIIARDVVAETTSMAFSTITHLYIYEVDVPASPSAGWQGSYSYLSSHSLTPAKVDRIDWTSGAPRFPPNPDTFDLASRKASGERIGIELDWNYLPPSSIVVPATLSQYQWSVFDSLPCS